MGDWLATLVFPQRSPRGPCKLFSFRQGKRHCVVSSFFAPQSPFRASSKREGHKKRIAIIAILALTEVEFAEKGVTTIIYVTLYLLAHCAGNVKLWSQVGHKGYDYMSSHICDIVFTSDLDISYASLAFKELSFQCKGAYTILNKQAIEQQCIIFVKCVYIGDCIKVYLHSQARQPSVTQFFES